MIDRKAILTITGVSVAAIVSGYFLLLLFTDISRVEAMGLEGIFIVTLLSHATMVARDIFVPLFLALTPLYNPILLGVTAGLVERSGTLYPTYWGWAWLRLLKEVGVRQRISWVGGLRSTVSGRFWSWR